MTRFDVEIFNPDPPRMVPDTARIVSALQNTTLHPLDLLVRESIQNSLDAALDDNVERDVRIDFERGEFDVKAFSEFLGPQCAFRLERGVSNLGLGNKFIAIRDSRCTGLTGSPKSNESNLYKLVYGFLDGKDVDNASAGGSYGVGKTVFLHFGIGFVCYYSRTTEGQRLALFYCKNNNKRDIFEKGFMPYQIAWWGRKDAESSHAVSPISDEHIITSFLEVFNLRPYAEGETGTTVVIPFFDEKIALGESKRFAPWLFSIDDYLRFSVLKWYVPRCRGDLKILANDRDERFRGYAWGRYLRCRFPDGKPLSLLPDGGSVSVAERKIFGLIRDLYDTANGKLLPSNDIYRFEVSHRNSPANKLYFSSPTMGWFAVKKINYSAGEFSDTGAVLTALAPENSIEDRRGFVLYCRKPGMIMTYDDSWGRVLSQVKCTGAEFFVGIFVVNSSNIVYADPDKRCRLCPLDQLFRETEKSDHYGWPADASSHGLKLVNSIISSIRASVSSKFTGLEADKSSTPKGDVSRGLGGVFMTGRSGFGGRPDNPYGNGGVEDDSNGEGDDADGKKRKTLGRIRTTKISFGEPSFAARENDVVVTVPAVICAAEKDCNIRLEVAVETDSSPLTASAWDESDGVFPIKVMSFESDTGSPCIVDENTASYEINLSGNAGVKVVCKLTYAVSRTDMSTLLIRREA